MSWKLIDKPRTVQADYKLVHEFKEMTPAPRDRPLSERRIDVYIKLLEEGQFRPVTWASAACQETGETYRVNGKHTSEMLSRLHSIPEFYVVLERYTCATLDDVAMLYATFDSKMQSRSAKDIYLSFAGVIPRLRDLPQNIINLSVCGMALETFGPEMYANTQPAERAELLMDNVPFVMWLRDLLEGGSTSSEIVRANHTRCPHLRRQTVVAAMFACRKRSVEKATEFWTEVRDETGGKPTDPSRKLARFLTTMSISKKDSGGKVQMTPKAVYAKCLHAWNAWRRGETTNLNYYPGKPMPVAV
jgi:hypothetical protein